MASERIEIVLKAAKRVDELRAERTRLTARIDSEIRGAETELARLIGEGDLVQIELPTEASGSATHQDRVVSILAGSPRATVAEMAGQLYGEVDDATKHKIRSLLWTLKKRGRIRKVGDAYEVTK